MKRKWRWCISWNNYVDVFQDYKKLWPLDGYWENDGEYITICADEFRRLFGFLPPSDKPVKVEFTGRVVE